MMPALIACTSSPVPGTSTTSGDVRRLRDVDFVLTDTDGLDEDHVLAGGGEDDGRIAGRARQSAQLTARRHAADEHAGVSGVRAHADAVAEDGASGEGTRRVDCQHSHRQPLACRRCVTSWSTSVLLPAPGGPVTPMTQAPAARRVQHRRSARVLRAVSFSTSEIARASARASATTDALGETTQIHLGVSRRIGCAASSQAAAERSPAAGSRSFLRRWS